MPVMTHADPRQLDQLSNAFGFCQPFRRAHLLGDAEHRRRGRSRKVLLPQLSRAAPDPSPAHRRLTDKDHAGRNPDSIR